MRRFRAFNASLPLPNAAIVGTDGIVRWQGYPLDPSDRLTRRLARTIVERDAQRRDEEKAKGGGGGDK